MTYTSNIAKKLEVSLFQILNAGFYGLYSRTKPPVKRIKVTLESIKL